MSIDSRQIRSSRMPWRGDLWGSQLRQFVLYAAISVAALAVDYGLLIFLTEYFGIY
jgi:hypothetical protein